MHMPQLRHLSGSMVERPREKEMAPKRQLPTQERATQPRQASVT